MRVPQCVRDRQRGKNGDRSLDRLLQRGSTAFRARRQDAQRGLCYAGNRGENGGVMCSRIHLSQAAKLSRKPGPPLTSAFLEKPTRLAQFGSSYRGPQAESIKPAIYGPPSRGKRTAVALDSPLEPNGCGALRTASALHRLTDL